MVLIQNIESKRWFRAKGRGTTEFQTEAHRFTLAEAQELVAWVDRMNPGKPALVHIVEAR